MSIPKEMPSKNIAPSLATGSENSILGNLFKKNNIPKERDITAGLIGSAIAAIGASLASKGAWDTDIGGAVGKSVLEKAWEDKIIEEKLDIERAKIAQDEDMYKLNLWKAALSGGGDTASEKVDIYTYSPEEAKRIAENMHKAGVIDKSQINKVAIDLLSGKIKTEALSDNWLPFGLGSKKVQIPLPQKRKISFGATDKYPFEQE